ncbi:hypothetical protein KDX31_07945 [Amphritea atlantica]|uniref:Transmembrane protein n=1 Tax=Amphritea atlantica TaxID=355243 RepID=A0ABY5GY11_9GAMM|nr:hypothetical protein KDX31_07945 [Amphritea atlantica]
MKRQMKKILHYSSLYFVIVFTVGFVLGTIRVLLLVPYFGEHTAELLEMPLMLLACFFSARFVASIAGNRVVAWQMLAVGVLALLYLLVVELSIVIWLRDLSVSEYVESKYSLAGLAYVVLLILYALFPYSVYRSKNSP